MTCKARVLWDRDYDTCGKPEKKHGLCEGCLRNKRESLARQIFELKQSLVVKQAELEDLA